MTNEANIFYKPLRRLSFNDGYQTKNSVKSFPETINMHVVAMACDEPVKLNKSPRLMVWYNLQNAQIYKKYLNLFYIFFLFIEMDCCG